MEIKGFNENEISEQNKAALQSETWKRVRKEIREKVRHFTTEKDTENIYGDTWDQVVKEYLKSGYKEESSRLDITVLGVTYKVLKRAEVTAFYDADGIPLFDVTNERLEKEYEWLENSADMTGEENNPSTNVTEADEKENSKSVKQKAMEKLEKERNADKDKTFSEPVIGHLLERCKEDERLALDVVQEHKTWKKCIDYIFKKAQKQAVDNRATIRDDVVYKWAEEYYHKDDKAEDEKEEKAAVDKKKSAPKKLPEGKKNVEPKETVSKKEEEKAVDTKEDTQTSRHSKRQGKTINGQISMFDLLSV